MLGCMPHHKDVVFGTPDAEQLPQHGLKDLCKADAAGLGILDNAALSAPSA